MGKEENIKAFLKKAEAHFRAKRLKKEGTDNRGMTLVELLVAITILTLIVFPTMEVFVTATKANSRARTELQTTVTANSVLESAKSFSIYVYDKQCNKTYSAANANEFTLLAGQIQDGSVKSLIQAGGSCYQVVFGSNEDDKNKIVSVTKDSTEFKDKTVADRYAYVINGIKQSTNTYDAVIIFDRKDYVQSDGSTSHYMSIEVDGKTYGENDINNSEIKDTYNKEYAITVLIYKGNRSTSLENSEYIGEDVTAPEKELLKVTGSKLDSAMPPSGKTSA